MSCLNDIFVKYQHIEPESVEHVQTFAADLEELLHWSPCETKIVELSTMYIRLRHILSAPDSFHPWFYAIAINNMIWLINTDNTIIGYDRDYSYKGPLLNVAAENMFSPVGWHNFYNLIRCLKVLSSNQPTNISWVDIIRHKLVNAENVYEMNLPIASLQWYLSQLDSKYIHVYNFPTMHELESANSTGTLKEISTSTIDQFNGIDDLVESFNKIEIKPFDISSNFSLMSI